MSVELVVVGASQGGLAAVRTLLAGLPADFGAAVLVVQHRAEGGEERLAALLDTAGPLPVREADDKSPWRAGEVLVAPPGYHALVQEDGVALSTEGLVRFSRPSIDLALETAAEAFGDRVIGVVLTGANEDGAIGLTELRRRGGIAVVQDPAGAEARAMPDAAVRDAAPHRVLPLGAIAPLLVEVVG